MCSMPNQLHTNGITCCQGRNRQVMGVQLGISLNGGVPNHCDSAVQAQWYPSDCKSARKSSFIPVAPVVVRKSQKRGD